MLRAGSVKNLLRKTLHFAQGDRIGFSDSLVSQRAIDQLLLRLDSDVFPVIASPLWRTWQSQRPTPRLLRPSTTGENPRKDINRFV